MYAEFLRSVADKLLAIGVPGSGVFGVLWLITWGAIALVYLLGVLFLCGLLVLCYKSLQASLQAARRARREWTQQPLGHLAAAQLAAQSPVERPKNWPEPSTLGEEHRSAYFRLAMRRADGFRDAGELLLIVASAGLGTGISGFSLTGRGQIWLVLAGCAIGLGKGAATYWSAVSSQYAAARHPS